MALAARLEADLVVDCSGRSSRASEWLMSLGYPEVELEVVDAQAGYSTCWYQAPPADQRPANWWWKGIFLSPSAKPTREEDYYVALILPIEGDRFPADAGFVGRPCAARRS